MSYTLISTVTLTSNQASISFNSIPATFDDLVVVISARSAAFQRYDGLFFRLNGDTTNYSNRTLGGSGTAASSYTAPYGISTTFAWAGTMNDNNTTANTFSSHAIYFPNYRSSSAKSFSVDAVAESNITEAFQVASAGLWNNTAAITSIVFNAPFSGQNLVTGTSASLYGVTRGSSGGVVVS